MFILEFFIALFWFWLTIIMIAFLVAIPITLIKIAWKLGSCAYKVKRYKEYHLFLDDERKLSRYKYNKNPRWVVAKNTHEALVYIYLFGLPSLMSLDHDLGDEDTSMNFLKALQQEFPNGPVPKWIIHSENIIGQKNIQSFLESWEKSLTS